MENQLLMIFSRWDTYFLTLDLLWHPYVKRWGRLLGGRRVHTPKGMRAVAFTQLKYRVALLHVETKATIGVMAYVGLWLECLGMMNYCC